MNYVYKVVPKALGKNTYDAKEKLKKCGCRYNSILGWYAKEKNSLPNGFTYVTLDWDKMFTKDNVFTVEGAAEYLSETLSAAKTIDINSEFYGEQGTRYHNLKCTLHSKQAMNTAYGLKYRYYLLYQNSIFEWISTVNYEITPNSTCTFDGTVKGYYNNYGAKITQMSRCKLSDIDLAPVVENKGFELK